MRAFLRRTGDRHGKIPCREGLGALGTKLTGQDGISLCPSVLESSEVREDEGT